MLLNKLVISTLVPTLLLLSSTSQAEIAPLIQRAFKVLTKPETQRILHSTPAGQQLTKVFGPAGTKAEIEIFIKGLDGSKQLEAFVNQLEKMHSSLNKTGEMAEFESLYRSDIERAFAEAHLSLEHPTLAKFFSVGKARKLAPAIDDLDTLAQFVKSQRSSAESFTSKILKLNSEIENHRSAMRVLINRTDTGISTYTADDLAKLLKNQVAEQIERYNNLTSLIRAEQKLLFATTGSDAASLNYRLNELGSKLKNSTSQFDNDFTLLIDKISSRASAITGRHLDSAGYYKKELSDLYSAVRDEGPTIEGVIQAERYSSSIAYNKNTAILIENEMTTRLNDTIDTINKTVSDIVKLQGDLSIPVQGRRPKN